MANDAKKGITVKVDADHHAEISRYLQENGMTMTEFVTKALEDELHPKITEGEKIMANTRTIAFQVSEDFYNRLKDYLQRNGVTQRQFLIDLIEDELDREQAELEGQDEDDYEDEEEDEDESEDESADFDEPEGVSAEVDDEGESVDESADLAEIEAFPADSEGEEETESEDEDEDEGFSMSM